MANDLGLKPGAATGGGPVILEMKISHGDIVIMNGCLLQEAFEHQVTPKDKLRFALTCRAIPLESLPADKKPDYEVEDEKVRYDGLALKPPMTRE